MAKMDSSETCGDIKVKVSGKNNTSVARIIDRHTIVYLLQVEAEFVVKQLTLWLQEIKEKVE
jgi:predicted  nucleic acid-binding Zn-ribbon protein